MIKSSTDEAYMKVKGEWTYLYRKIEKLGNAMDFILPKKRDNPTAMR